MFEKGNQKHILDMFIYKENDTESHKDIKITTYNTKHIKHIKVYFRNIIVQRSIV